MLRRKSPFFALALFAVLTRFISAATHSSWAHADEWYQTVEISNLLLNRFGTFSQEMVLHLRNLSWPALLCVPLGVARILGPGSIWLRVFSFQFFTGLLDLVVLWGFIQLMSSAFPAKPASLAWRKWGAFLLIFPFFTVADSIRPNAEHASSIATWASLGLLATGFPGWAGFAAVAIGAMKYSSGLLSLGIFAAVLIQAFQKRKFKPLGNFLLGVALGLVFFGAADAIGYGRPWESLWMYLQYNFLTDAGTSRFGVQSPSVYFEFFRTRWFGALFPLGALLAVGGIRGLYLGLRKTEPWAWASVFYIAGLFLVSHKEARFIWPLEPLLFFGAWVAAVELARKIKVGAQTRRVIQVAVILLLAVNAAIFLRALWGETWRPNQTYFELPRHMAQSPDACAVVTMRNPPSVLYPWREKNQVPSIALGYLDEKSEIAWVNQAPSCEPDQSVLFHLDRPHPKWTKSGCELLASGFIAVLPKNLWQWALAKNLLSGPWYRCPMEVAATFQSQVENPLLSGLTHLSKLPGFGVSGSELIHLAEQNQAVPNCKKLCFPLGP